MKEGKNSVRAGQAIVELVVALVVVLVLLAGILQVGSLGLTQTRLMNEARRLAGVQAMQEGAPFAGPEYIAERTAGNDQTVYSRDDGFTTAYAGDFQAGVLSYAHPDQLSRVAPSNEVTVMAQSGFPHLLFGLVHGEPDPVTVPLLPVVRNLIYRANGVEVVGHAWLTWTKGIY